MSNKINAKSFIKNMAGFSIATWVGFFISFIATPIITRIFIPDTMGRINLFITVVNFGFMVVLCGMDQTYTRFFFEGIRGKNHQVIFLYSIIIIIVCSIAFFVFGFPFYAQLTMAIVGESNIVVYLMLFISIFTTAILRMYTLSYRMNQDIIKFSIISILIVLITKVTYVIAAIWDRTYYSAVILSTIPMLFLMIFYFTSQKDVYPPQIKGKKVDRQMLKIMLRFGIPLVPASVMSWLNNSLSNFIIKSKLNFASLGVYSSALSIASLIGLIQTGFNTYWTAFVYKNYKEEKAKISEVHQYITFVMVLCGLFIILFQDLIFLLLGQNYRGAKSFFPFLLISPICYTISETTGMGIAIAKKTYLNLYFIIASLLTNIILAFILIPILGELGAAVASAFAGIIYMVVRTILGEKYYKCSLSYKKTVFSLLFFFVASIINSFMYNNILVRTLVISSIIFIITLMYKSHFIRLLSVAKDLCMDILNKVRERG